MADVQKRYPDIDETRRIHEIGRRLINVMVNDLLAETSHRLADARIRTVEDVRHHGGALVAFGGGRRSHGAAQRSLVKARLAGHHHPHQALDVSEQFELVLLDLLLDKMIQ